MHSATETHTAVQSPPTPLPDLEAIHMKPYGVPLSATPLVLNEPEPGRSPLSLFAQAMTFLVASIELVHLGLAMSPLK